MKLLPVFLACTPIALANPVLANLSPIPLDAFANGLITTQPLLLSQATPLPNSIATSVLQTHAVNFNQPSYLFRISEASAQNWPDGCLGLAEPFEFCAQSIVPGWRVIVTDGMEAWTYRTDESGLILRLESGSTPVAEQPNAPRPIAHGWETQLRWSKVTDSGIPALVYQLAVLQKPQTTYASAVYQFYARQRGETNWTYFHTTLGARLINDAAAPFDLPLEMMELNQFDNTVGEFYKWSTAEIRVAVLLRYDLSQQQRDLRLRFEHHEPYASIAPISLAQLTIQPNNLAPGPFQSQTFPPQTNTGTSTPSLPSNTPVLPPLSTPYPGMPSGQ